MKALLPLPMSSRRRTCPTPDEPGKYSVYQEVRFSEDIYNNIREYYKEQVKAEDHQGSTTS